MFLVHFGAHFFILEHFGAKILFEILSSDTMELSVVRGRARSLLLLAHETPLNDSSPAYLTVSSQINDK